MKTLHLTVVLHEQPYLRSPSHDERNWPGACATPQHPDRLLSMARPFADNAVMELPFARPGREARRGKPLPLTGLGIETAAR